MFKNEINKYLEPTGNLTVRDELMIKKIMSERRKVRFLNSLFDKGGGKMIDVSFSVSHVERGVFL